MAQLVECKPFKFNVTGSNPVFCKSGALKYAGVAEWADAWDLKSHDGNIVRVQLPSPAPTIWKMEVVR